MFPYLEISRKAWVCLKWEKKPQRKKKNINHSTFDFFFLLDFNSGGSLLVRKNFQIFLLEEDEQYLVISKKYFEVKKNKLAFVSHWNSSMINRSPNFMSGNQELVRWILPEQGSYSAFQCTLFLSKKWEDKYKVVRFSYTVGSVISSPH